MNVIDGQASLVIYASLIFYSLTIDNILNIIVLLILAGVSIAMLTGQNGILTQAQNAKQVTEKSAEQEKVQVAASSSRDNDGQLSFERLKAEIENQGGTILGDSIPTTITINNTLYRVNSTGEVTQRISGGTLGTVTGTETSNTTVQDALGNQVVVPAGFKVVNPNDYVTDGIIIEDVGYKNTKGSQFVWIPVGDVIKEDKSTINIKLSRYTFANDGTPTDQGSNVINYYFSEINTSTYGNTTAKENIESEDSGFRKSAQYNHGYYIGRYEARDKDSTEARTSTSSEANQLVCTTDNYVYNYLTQQQAAKLSRNMYSGTSFQSDLLNSYAWDTAILFLQTFGTNSKYSRQTSLYNSLAVKGSGSITNENEKDIVCNVFDMANNCFEWETETSSQPNWGHCMYRGASYKYYSLSSLRNDGPSCPYDNVAFRPILYL